MNQESVICAANSVQWYEAIFGSHGLSGATVDGMWLSRDRPPPYYSNAVTVASSAVAAQTATIGDLVGTLRSPWSVKDSFSVLELSSLGFQPLFEANWIWRDAGDIPPPARSDIVWRRVATVAELERWEGAWRENGSPATSRVFVPELLADPTIALFGAYRGDAIVAGCAANCSDEAVGFSNLFIAGGDDDRTTAEAVSEVGRFGAGLPIVGYERGERLASVGRLGFRSVGQLRVWLTATG
jgi:hypothetical protein